MAYLEHCSCSIVLSLSIRNCRQFLACSLRLSCTFSWLVRDSSCSWALVLSSRREATCFCRSQLSLASRMISWSQNSRTCLMPGSRSSSMLRMRSARPLTSCSYCALRVRLSCSNLRWACLTIISMRSQRTLCSSLAHCARKSTCLASYQYDCCRHRQLCSTAFVYSWLQSGCGTAWLLPAVICFSVSDRAAKSLGSRNWYVVTCLDVERLQSCLDQISAYSSCTLLLSQSTSRPIYFMPLLSSEPESFLIFRQAFLFQAEDLSGRGSPSWHWPTSHSSSAVLESSCSITPSFCFNCSCVASSLSRRFSASRCSRVKFDCGQTCLQRSSQASHDRILSRSEAVSWLNCWFSLISCPRTPAVFIAVISALACSRSFLSLSFRARVPSSSNPSASMSPSPYPEMMAMSCSFCARRPSARLSLCCSKTSSCI